ncbi:hypothetical protein SAMN05216198_3348 [Halopseudomonas litoralis]|uniref:Uncharacterized protein n=1 Tax=Halopseudomonas litoralis TaxID=797277 RepID=A0A1H1WRM4_9GAMM|nr:hypothetical protein [Halopseudomonas litoralis]SDS98996.1 hypothetical protein SAMN05216198_3348 [Halopseudomonas litoralis]
MSGNVCILDSGPACEPDKLIVEIIGKQHPETQRLLICDANGQPLDGVTAAAEEEEISGAGVSSLLKIWDWEEQPGESLHLEIASQSGPPIRLPLLTDLRATPRQVEAQLNQIVPVVPCTALPSITQQDHSGIPVLARSGYIYVFAWGKLWRELEMRFTEQGTRYFDIDVAAFRDEQGFVEGKRTATGAALEDIWLPSQWNGRWAGSLDLMFSEIQLSAARLQHYERHENYLSPRVSMPRLLVTEATWQQHWSDAPSGLAMLEALQKGRDTPSGSAGAARFRMASNVFPVSLCAPQRQRQPGHEWLLDQPARMLCDLTGTYPEQALASTHQATESWRTGVASDPPAEFESEAWRSCYHGCEADALTVWQAQDAQPDALQSVRDRQLYAVLLPDPMYRLRHLHARIGSLQTLLRYCTQLAMEHSHHASALLLQNVAVPSRIGGHRNPLADSIRNKLSEAGKREINIATAAVERANAWKLLESAQLALANTLELKQSQQCMGDHLSQDAFEYAASMLFAVQLMASIASSPAQIDPLAIKGDIHDAVSGFHLHRPGRNPGQQLLTDIVNRESHPLHTMLWPAVRYDELFAEYRKPAEAEPNNGDARFRATALARLEDMDAPDSESDTLDGVTLAALMESGTLQDSFTAHASFKAGMAVLSKINEILSSSIKAAENQAANIRQQRDGSNQRVAADRAALEQATAARVKLHGMTAEHLRQTMPRAFAGALFIDAGNSSGNQRYLFGLEDLPEVDPQAARERLYGKYLDGAGNRLATTNGHSARRSGQPIVPESGVYFAIPRNSDTARILSNLNQAHNQEALAGSTLLASRANAEQLGWASQRATESAQRAQEGRVHRALNSRPFSAAILMMEMWNVQVAMAEAEKVIRERGDIRFIAGYAGVGLDAVIALEVLLRKVAGNQTILGRTANKAFFEISDDFAKKFLGSRIAENIVKAVTVRIAAQIVAGTIFAGLSVSDAIHSAQWSDNAVWGHSMMAVGGIIGAAAPLFTGSALFGPMGVIAVTLIIGGAILVAHLSNTSFEDWLAGSIFNQEGGFSDTRSVPGQRVPETDSSASHLKASDEAFYRLVGLLTGVTIQIADNPDYDPRVLNDGSRSETVLRKRANTLITVRSNVNGMMSALDSADSIVRCLLVRNEVHQSGSLNIERNIRRDQPDRSTPLLQHITSDAWVLYVNTPVNPPQIHAFHKPDNYHWEVRAQFRFQDPQNNRTWIFPAPGPKVELTGAARKTEPDFQRINQPLWADQETHAAKGAAG